MQFTHGVFYVRSGPPVNPVIYLCSRVRLFFVAFIFPDAQLVEELLEVNLRLVAVGSGGASGELGGLKKKRCSMYRLCGWQNAPRAVREVCPSDWDTCDT